MRWGKEEKKMQKQDLKYCVVALEPDLAHYLCCFGKAWKIILPYNHQSSLNIYRGYRQGQEIPLSFGIDLLEFQALASQYSNCL